MKYLYHPDYQALTLSERTVLFAKDTIGAASASENSWQQEICRMLDSEEPKLTTSLASHNPPLLLKTNTLKYFSQRVRARFGIQRQGRFEWATAELDTALRMQGKPYIPEIYAYGWRVDGFGLPEQTFSVTENLSNTVTLEEYILKQPERSTDAMKLAFDTLLTAMKDGLLHLDPWAGNFLLCPDLSQCWLIDLEFSKMNSPAPLEKQLGFAFGFFYRSKFEKHWSRTSYLSFVEGWLSASAPELSFEDFQEHFRFYLDNHVKRKKRFAAF